uniref:HMA domain-containing protein n=2 Tax=Leersia perrieri TaxID=77586 RepID=A0A0D9XBU8_9ORYZ
MRHLRWGEKESREQKVEIKVPIVDEKKKSKIMQTISKQSGILSMTVDREKNTVTVVGNEDLDVTDLTTVLRKRMRSTHIVIDTVTQVDEKKEKEEKERKKMEEEYYKNYWPSFFYPPHYAVHQTCQTADACCLM